MGNRRSTIQVDHEKKSRLQLEEGLSNFDGHLTCREPHMIFHGFGSDAGWTSMREVCGPSINTHRDPSLK
jgi:hypothetical protein